MSARLEGAKRTKLLSLSYPSGKSLLLLSTKYELDPICFPVAIRLGCKEVAVSQWTSKGIGGYNVHVSPNNLMSQLQQVLCGDPCH